MRRAVTRLTSACAVPEGLASFYSPTVETVGCLLPDVPLRRPYWLSHVDDLNGSLRTTPALGYFSFFARLIFLDDACFSPPNSDSGANVVVSLPTLRPERDAKLLFENSTGSRAKRARGTGRTS